MCTNKENVKPKLDRWALVVLIVGGIFMLGAPLLFTRDFGLVNLANEKYSFIATTISGLTAPIASLIGAILIFLALRAQVYANGILSDQFNTQKRREVLDQESKKIHELYSQFKNSVDSFGYSTLNSEEFGTGIRVYGSEAIYKLFKDFYCNYHESTEEMMSNPKITELMSILELCLSILERLKSSPIEERDVLILLTKHQYEYRIFPFIRANKGKLERYTCTTCDKDHGLPSQFVTLVESINNQLGITL